ncbi:MAG: fimbrial protein [Iodobacter sp.]
MKYSFFFRALFASLVMYFPLCSYALHCVPSGGDTQDISFGEINISPNLQNNYLWTSPNQTVKLNCTGEANETMQLAGLFKKIDGVNIPGIDWEVQVFNQTCRAPDNNSTDSVCASGIKLRTGEQQEVMVNYIVRLFKSGDINSNKTTYPVNVTTLRLAENISKNEFFKVNINGSINIIPKTCELRVGDINRTLTLPTVAAGSLPDIGSKAGRSNFELSAGNCSAGLKNAKFTFYGTPDNNNNTLFANSGTAKGVAIHLGTRIDNKTIAANGVNNDRVADINSGSVELPLFVEYMRTDTVSAGTVLSTVTFNIDYN